MLSRYERGDTIIEVLLAFTVFSMLAVGVLSVMNRGANTAQRALEITLVRQQINAQAEALRAAHQAFAVNPTDPDAQWPVAIGKQGNYTYDQDNPECPRVQASLGASFIMNPIEATVVNNPDGWFEDINGPNAPPYAQLVTTGSPKAYGLWIQAEEDTTGSNPHAYNFRIRACWYSAGENSQPVELETLVRLYDPES